MQTNHYCQCETTEISGASTWLNSRCSHTMNHMQESQEGWEGGKNSQLFKSQYSFLALAWMSFFWNHNWSKFTWICCFSLHPPFLWKWHKHKIPIALLFPLDSSFCYLRVDLHCQESQMSLQAQQLKFRGDAAAWSMAEAQVQSDPSMHYIRVGLLLQDLHRTRHSLLAATFFQKEW